MMLATTRLPSELVSELVARILDEDIAGLADVVQVPLATKVARLEKSPGRRPVLYVNATASPEQLWLAVMDVKRVLADGPDATRIGRRVRQLYAVT